MLDPDQVPILAPMVRLVQVVDRAGQLIHVPQQLVARHAGPPLRQAGVETVHQALVAQRHRDHQAIGDPGGELDIEQVAMADVADHLQRPLLHAPLAGVEPEELHGDVKIAGRTRLPDLAEPAPAEQADQLIAGEGLDALVQDERPGHGALQRRSADQRRRSDHITPHP